MPSYEDLRWDAESSCAACHGYGCERCEPDEDEAPALVSVPDCSCRDCRSELKW